MELTKEDCANKFASPQHNIDAVVAELCQSAIKAASQGEKKRRQQQSQSPLNPNIEDIQQQSNVKRPRKGSHRHNEHADCLDGDVTDKNPRSLENDDDYCEIVGATISPEEKIFLKFVNAPGYKFDIPRDPFWIPIRRITKNRQHRGAIMTRETSSVRLLVMAAESSNLLLGGETDIGLFYEGRRCKTYILPNADETLHTALEEMIISSMGISNNGWTPKKALSLQFYVEVYDDGMLVRFLLLHLY